MAKKKDYKIKNADTITDAQIAVKRVSMDRILPTVEENGQVTDNGYSVKATYAIFKDETSYQENKAIPITEIRNFIWDGKDDFNTLALDSF